MPKLTLPAPYVFIHVPKTSGRFVRWLLNRLDYSQWCRLWPLKLSDREDSFSYRLAYLLKRKNYRWLPYGCAHFNHSHTRHYELNTQLQSYPHIVILRDPMDWYISYLAFFMYQGEFLSQSNHWYFTMNEEMAHNPQIQYFVNEYLPRNTLYHWFNLCSSNPEAFLFFMKHIRLPYMLKKMDPSFDTHRSIELDYMSCMYIWYLTDHPTKILSMGRDALDEYFESGAYIKDVHHCHFIRQEKLRQQLSRLLINQFNYHHQLVDAVFDIKPSQNITRADRKDNIQSYIAESTTIQNEIKSSRIHYYQACVK